MLTHRFFPHSRFSLRHRLEFATVFTQRELKARYKNAFFGFFWMILNPVFQMLIIGAVFQFYLKLEVPNYFQYLFIGLLAWNFFSLSLSKATPVIVHERSLIQKASFPREALVISIVASNCIHFLIGLLLVVPFLDVTLISVVGVIGSILWLALFTLGLSLLFASLNVKFRDVSFIVQAFLSVWFYATPIIYSISLLAENIRSLVFLNPLTTVFGLLHSSLLDTGVLIPTPYVWWSLIVSAATIALGFLVFFKENKNFADRL